MNKDYYKTLGVEKGATQDEIKKAFRKLAHEHHPDKKGGDDKKFKEASEAYDTLGNPEKRASYDRFGSGFNPGANQGGGFNAQDFGGFDFSGFQGGFNGQNVEFDLGDILGQFFGGGGRRPRKGRNLRTTLTLSFKESIFGGEKTITVNGVKMSIVVPSGIDTGMTLRVRGKGEALEGGEPGDLLVTMYVEEDKRFKKEGYHLITELEIALTTALLGGEEKIETLDGELKLKIPEGIHYGEMLRIKEKGVPNERGRRGDLYVRVLNKMPKKLSRKAKELIDALKEEGI